jgi:hypothetical protein
MDVSEAQLRGVYKQLQNTLAAWAGQKRLPQALESEDRHG